jgi:hypothetical protein
VLRAGDEDADLTRLARLPGGMDRPGPGLRDVDAVRSRRHFEDPPQLLGRPCPLLVGPEGDQRERAVLRRRELRPEPVLGADREPATGVLYVAFENFNTPDEHQWVVVRSSDGGQTFQGPFFVTPSFDVNFRARPDCAARGAGSSLTNSCFRIPQTGAIVVDRRGGAFANDLYLVMSDNRNGTRENTNTDVFFLKSIDGGSSWIGPTRVNNDDSDAPANRDCGRMGQPACPPTTLESATGNDQWWPWIDISDRGDQRQDARPAAGYELGRTRVADEPPAAGELSGLDLGRSMPRHVVDADGR